MTDKFRSDYLTEADEYIPDEEKSQTPTEDQTDDEFGVNQYDGSEMSADEPSADDGEIAPTYGDDMEADETSDEEAGVSDISEIFSIVSEFFPDEDEQKVKDWIESTMETENISTEAEFLDLFDDAESMETSYKSFGGDEDAVEAEEEATEPEEDSEKDEDSDDEEKDEADEKKEPVKESRKKFSRKKRLNESEGFKFEIGDLVCSKVDGYSDIDRQRAALIVDRSIDANGLKIYEVKKRYRSGDVETEYETDLVGFYYCSDDINNTHDMSAYRNIAKRESLTINNPIDHCENDDVVTESKKVVKEAYSEDLSKELQLFMTIKTSTQSDFVKKLATEAIDKIRAELKKPADQPKTPVTESVRDRIRAKLRANRK